MLHATSPAETHSVTPQPLQVTPGAVASVAQPPQAFAARSPGQTGMAAELVHVPSLHCLLAPQLEPSSTITVPLASPKP